ncbi:MAG: SPFH domain-containing protein [Phycisphaerae bacterium]
MGMLANSIGGTRRLVAVVVAAAVAGVAAYEAIEWTIFRVYVPPGKCLVRIAKQGAELPAGQTLAENGQKGIQRETWGPGRYFLNPVLWDTKLVDLVEIRSGRPDTWHWVHTTNRLPQQRGAGMNIISGEFPEVGILVRKSGKSNPAGSKEAVVDLASGYSGIVREVLTPGVYRINPYEYDVRKEPAVVIPAGFVGVVTNQIGAQTGMVEVPDVGLQPTTTEGSASQPAAAPPMKRIRPLAKPGERGTLQTVLPPGVYFLNPYVVRVKITEVGFNEFSQLASQSETIRFPSKSGYDIELGVTVVWGLHPRHAAEVINEFGTTTEVLEKVIKPQLRSICRNQGSLFEARDFIRGDKREEFQTVLTSSLREVCHQKHVELLLALISTIDVRSREGQTAEQGEELKKEIQDSYIAIEKQITNEKLQATAKKQALLEEAKKKVDVARETIQAGTRRKVANILAEGKRKAAETEARGRLQVATIEQQIALLEAEKTQVLGKAAADVERLKRQADADGKQLLVSALGSGAAYNLYTFAENFEPDNIRLIFAGEGTFWTDLKGFTELGAARMLQERPAPAKPPATAKPAE